MKPRLKVSREGVLLIKSLEGFRPRAMPRAEGGWVIGYGHTRSAREGVVISEADAELLLQYDLLPIVAAVNDQVTGPMNQHQFDALASFAFSVGVDRFIASDVVERINAGVAGDAAEALGRWPVRDSTPPIALRRRAAERALFVADPARAVTLADLLTAALPEPERPTPPAPANDLEPADGPAPVAADRSDARAHAVATLLGEAQHTPAPSIVTLHPAAPVHTEPHPAPDSEPASPALPEPAPTTDAAREMSDAEGRLAILRYSPYPTAGLGPLPGLAADPAAAFVLDTLRPPPVTLPPIPPSPAPAAAPAPVAPPEPPLVLTPLRDEDIAPAPRPVWPEEQRYVVQQTEEAALFGDDDGLPSGFDPVLRHEAASEPTRGFDWGETGAFVIMGGVGLVSFGAAMAAFRLSSEQGSPLGETAIIGWVLALIGATCVGVSAYNLYRRWGRGQGG